MEDFFDLHFDWKVLLKNELAKPYIQTLKKNILSAYAQQTVFPNKSKLFSAFNTCLPNQVKVVILGQDPYHGIQQANGLSFSVNQGQRIPPSLRNIFKELQQDIPGFQMPHHGDLTAWAKQGVLLINSVLTVKAHEAGSHKNMGWEYFTDAVIHTLSEERSQIVFLLWGQYAIDKAQLINQNKHLVLTAAHPSPLARGAFFGCKHFSQTNVYLQQNHQMPIDWQLPEQNLFS